MSPNIGLSKWFAPNNTAAECLNCFNPELNPTLPSFFLFSDLCTLLETAVVVVTGPTAKQLNVVVF